MQAAALEALLDGRLSSLPRTALPGLAVAALEAEGLLGPGARELARRTLLESRTQRQIEWATWTLTQGELLEAFAEHCELELDEVEVLEREPERLVARWRRERSRIELRAGFLGVERLASETPTMLVGDIEGEEAQLVEAFVEDADLRSRLAVCDPGRLERLGTVQSSLFVYFEWFLRDAYGVKLLPSAGFTRGLIDRGIISLGMG